MFLTGNFYVIAQRKDILLNDKWFTIATPAEKSNQKFITMPPVVDKGWISVSTPHNWDVYHGYRRLIHGNRHGDSWYRRTFQVDQVLPGKRYFLYFEGVGSYAKVYVNGKLAGEHAGGRTSFTLDISNLIKKDGSDNRLSVHASHPENINDLPWVCGGCSDERGFSEGSQPMGIFRPVHLIVTSDIRIEPCGIHAWADINKEEIKLHINTRLKNYTNQVREIQIQHRLVDGNGKEIERYNTPKKISATDIIEDPSILILPANLKRWSPSNPYLYKIVSIISEGNKRLDSINTDFGFRTINWRNPSNQFYINDQPLFINGVAEYEHLIGQSHAFSNEQIISRMNWLRAAGFNAFRDGHQPHNLLYGQLCNQYGILWWTQLSAHVWYNTPEFRKQFKQLLTEWVIERRNDPSVILWGLQNESKLPEDFARECTELIRSLDPTASSQRLVTTCNGGEGTDWDVPQNWTGTYGGDPNTYDRDVRKQVLIGEYGAWRSIDLHSEGNFIQNGILSEDRMVQLMEQKIRLGESAKDSSAGQFFWLLTSHDNPGRVQGGEGLRELDRIGPVNYKGLLTPWEEPTDAFYMYRSNYVSALQSPMVYIVSHTWPNRWLKPGIKDSIIVYSNCDEVELFNDVNAHSLGKRKKNGIGTHFQWDKVEIKYNVLLAIGYINGKRVAADTIVLHHLPQAPGFNKLISQDNSLIKPEPGYNYLYRMNCGGPAYIDKWNSPWSADTYLPGNGASYAGSSSWTNEFEGIQHFFASQRRTFSPINGTADWSIFQTFRYGKDKLRFEFPVPNGEYRVELYFSEPWLGIGGGINATGMRVFDVAINNQLKTDDLDIWNEVGTNRALKKVYNIKTTNGKLVISFPESKSGQAIIAGIAIASIKKGIKPAPAYSLINVRKTDGFNLRHWLDIGDKVFSDQEIYFHQLPSDLFGADWIQFGSQQTKVRMSSLVNEEADVFLSIKSSGLTPSWLTKDFESTGTTLETDEGDGTKYLLFRRRYKKGETINLPASPDYLVFFQPASRMQPAYDLKPITPYRSSTIILKEGAIKETIGGRECAVIRSSSETIVEWPIQTGVADIYSLTVKYLWPNNTSVNGRIQLIGAGNTMMLDQPVTYTFTRPGKWNQYTINTGNMINAGNYKVRIITGKAEGLAISGLDIQ